METNKNMTQELIKWFNERPSWLIKAINILQDKKNLNEQDYLDLYGICLKQAKNQKSNITISQHQGADGLQDYDLRITSISEVKNINALSPTKPLEFGDNLTVVYGLNGSGKTGYVRILKRICNAKNNKDILHNIYKHKQEETQTCKIEYKKNNVAHEKELNVNEVSIIDLACTDIFDAERGKIYMEGANEVRYEPQLLLLFSNLVDVCTNIAKIIDEKITNSPSSKPSIPYGYNNTESEKWYKNLSAETSNEEINKYCLWEETSNEDELSVISKRLATPDPSAEANKISNRITNAQDLLNSTKNHIKELSDENCKKITEIKKKLSISKETAKFAAEQNFENEPLKGVGGDIWKNLWMHARIYSESVAYEGSNFPVTLDNSLCVLCHQSLSNEAKRRMESFENFVKNSTQKEVSDGQKELTDSINLIKEIKSIENVKLKIKVIDILSEDKEQFLLELYGSLHKRKEQIGNMDFQSALLPLPCAKDLFSEMDKKNLELINSEKQYTEDAKQDNRENLTKEKNELEARKWLSQQISCIKEEIARLKEVGFLKKAKKLTDTTPISRKKSELAEKLITEKFISNFNSELYELEAKKINVELEKSKAEKGRILHKIILSEGRDNKQPNNILSEGERSIVGLSAFLADVAGKEYSAPFIFDDPISSLDQKFEEAVARRLVKLSAERQVIIFTHRISLFGFINEYADKEHIKNVCIENIGEPVDVPFNLNKPKGALNELIGEINRDEHNANVESICMKFRTIIERVIEEHLLGGIVKRHRRSVTTMGKLCKLALINKDDCMLIGDLMTKYSAYVHSHSEESPVALPTQDELKEDLGKLKNWIEGFEKRKNDRP